MEQVRQELIAELETLHRQQRGWQRTTSGETLDYDAIAKLSDKQLSDIIIRLKSK